MHIDLNTDFDLTQENRQKRKNNAMTKLFIELPRFYSALLDRNVH